MQQRDLLTKQALCKCCQQREPAGYIGYGRFLDDLCRKCWSRNSETKKETGEFWSSKKAGKE